jgi:GTP-binding protein
MHFVDECVILAKAGDGGNGCVAFDAGPGRPRGGPTGGDGGNGGSVIFVATDQISTLLDLTFRREYKAKRGEHGGGRDRAGRGGEDLTIPVPVGVVVKDEAGNTLCDLSAPGQRFVAARGGQGGRGNLHFATSTWQAPDYCEEGEAGQERTLYLELKLLADVGLLGYPNVGKSSLIARVSRLRPKIANYPFTTLVPNLGVVSLPLGSRISDRSFVLADLPGLIAGAHAGHGLGHRFLRHLSRTRVLIHLLEVTEEPGRDPIHDFDVLTDELRRYDPELATRPQLVALAKLDLPSTRESYDPLKQAFAKRGIPLWAISAATGEGVADLMNAAYHLVRKPTASPAQTRSMA